MTDDRIERELREPGPRESAGRRPQLPADVRQARLLLSQIDGRRNAGRVVVRAAAVGLTAVAAVAVAIAIGASPRPDIVPGATTTPQASPPATSTPAATPTASQGASACAPSNLRAVADRWGGAAGSRGTTIHISLVSGPDCVLQGHPGGRILAGDGSVVIASLDPEQRADQPWVESADQPITMTAQGAGTTVSVVWGNWCAAYPAGPQLTLELRVAVDGPQLPVATATGDAIPVPPCNGSSEPSTLSTYPFGG
ncbi:MAG: hypothetical protein M3O77_00290 [Chloroflexota bacterium]|nr:hypothetical protein [Chloroflexota bacterium]